MDLDLETNFLLTQKGLSLLFTLFLFVVHMTYFENTMFAYGGGSAYGDGEHNSTGYACSNQYSDPLDKTNGNGSGSDYSCGNIKLEGRGAGTSCTSGIADCSGYSDDYLNITNIWEF